LAVNQADCSFDRDSKQAPVERRRDLAMARKITQPISLQQRLMRGDSVLGILRGLVSDLFDPYRPELHYMRGPGPKWHAKHAPVSTQAPMANPGLRQAAV
jgi:hypothetical protein